MPLDAKKTSPQPRERGSQVRESARAFAKLPLPVDYFWLVSAVLVGIGKVFDNGIFHSLLNVGGGRTQFGHPINHINYQIESINLVSNCQLQRCVDIAFLLVAPDMNALLIGAPVGQLVNQPRVAMEVKNYGLVWGKQSVKIHIR